MTTLVQAVIDGDTIAVIKLLTDNDDIDVRDIDQKSALAHAVQKKDYFLTRVLLYNGASVDCIDKGLATPLMYACLNGDLVLVKLLVEYNASLSYYDIDGYHPIDYALMSGNLDTVRYILSLDSYISFKKALKLSVQYGHLNILKYIVQEKPKRTFSLDQGEIDDILHNACEYNRLDIVQYAIEDLGANVESIKMSNTPLLIAARNGHYDILSYLVETAGADIYVTDDKMNDAEDIVRSKIDVLYTELRTMGNCDMSIPEKLQECYKSLFYMDDLKNAFCIIKHSGSCCICYEIIEAYAAITKCKHTFCAACIKKWLDEHGNCPYCRTELDIALSTIIVD